MPLFEEQEAKNRLLDLPMEENNLRNPEQIQRGTDKYFSKSRRVVEALAKGVLSEVWGSEDGCWFFWSSNSRTRLECRNEDAPHINRSTLTFKQCDRSVEPSFTSTAGYV